MNIDIKDSIVLDDNHKYEVVSKVQYESKNYYYLVDIHDNTNLKFCYEDKNELVELNNKDLLKKLLPLFFEKSISEITEV